MIRTIHPLRRSFSLDLAADDSNTLFLPLHANDDNHHNSHHISHHIFAKSKYEFYRNFGGISPMISPLVLRSTDAKPEEQNSTGQSSVDTQPNSGEMTAAVHWSGVDDIDDALAADFDGSLSGLGMELGTNSFNMSEALMALPNLSALKHEHHHHNHHVVTHHHSHHHHNNVGHSPHSHHNSRTTQSESSATDRSNGGSPLLHTTADEPNRPVAVVHGKKNRLAYGTEDELVTTAIKRFCLSNERETNLNEHNNRFLVSNNYGNDDECNDECANDIRCQHRHSSSVPDLRTTIPGVTNQSHSTASSPSSSSTPTPTTSSVLSQILAAQQYIGSTSSPSSHEAVPSNTLSSRSVAKFQYVLGASTSMAVKLHEETMTYLNQGQSYEIKLKKVGDLTEMRGKMLKTMVRVGFQERRLQYMEKELISQWKQQRPSERILEIDVPLSYGIHDIYDDPKDVNKCEFFWDPTKETGVFVKVNCISTEFTPKKHGGEKGVPFRIVIETYPHNGNSPASCLHAASCQVKVFKPKGADRKHKTDREKMSKKPLTEQEKFQPSYDCTVFIDCPLDSLFSFSNFTPTPSATTTSTSNSISTITSNTSIVSKNSESVKSLSEDNSSNSKSIIANNFPENDSTLDMPSTPSTPTVFRVLSPDADADQTSKWLQSNRFGPLSRTFSNFSGADILRLTREDLIQICGLTDGIRLFNALHSRTIRPRLTVYVCSQSDEVFRAVYLEYLTVTELTSKLSSILFSNNKINLNRICLYGPSGIRILITDDVVRNLCEESMYLIELNKDANSGDKYQALLKPFNN